VLLTLASAALFSGCGSQASGGLVPISAGLRGPEGLKASVYARGLRNASAFAFDRRGRLWVTTSAATEHTQDGVYLVARAGARPAKVVSGLKGPQGLTWDHDVLYVSSIGRVDAFSGLRGTRFTERRRLLAGPVKGSSNSGIVVAPNGRLVMSVSASCDHCTPRSTWSASIVSFRTDGGDLRIYANAVRAAYGLVFRPGTTQLFVSMNQRDDLGARTPGDWLALVREGQTWGFPAC
jgi:glucose/arabinose dehydrogenase